MQLLVEVGVGKSVEAWLSSQGHDVCALRDLNPRMEDHEILSLAVNEQRLVITMDKDFGELVYHSGQQHAGVLLLRLEDADSSEKVRIVEEIFSNYAGLLLHSFSVYKNGVLRSRP